MNRSLADQIDRLIRDKQPASKAELQKLLDQQSIRYSINEVEFAGYKQGLKVILIGEKNCFIRPRENRVYLIRK